MHNFQVMTKIRLILAVTFFFAFGINAADVGGQEEELEFIENVAALQKQLNSNEVPERERAEQQLMELGPDVLQFLDPLTKNDSSDYRERLTRIRTELEKKVAKDSVQASRVNLSGNMTLKTALEQLKKQTGNDVVADILESEKTELQLNLQQALFWDAMAEIKRQAGLEIDRYGSEQPQQIKLRTSNAAISDFKRPLGIAEIFQAQVIRVDSTVNLVNQDLGFTTIHLLLNWEPRLLPISIDIPVSTIKIIDEFGDQVMLNNNREIIYGVVQAEIPELEFPIQIPRIDRQIEKLKSISAKFDAVLPGSPETFRLKNLSKIKPGTEFEKASANLRFGGTRMNEDVYSVKLSLSFDEENNALESHQGWVFQNPVYLEDSQGNREQAISLESFQQDNERVTVNYYFLNEPGDRTLFYQTPTSIIKMPVKLELKDVPLP